MLASLSRWQGVLTCASTVAVMATSGSHGRCGEGQQHASHRHADATHVASADSDADPDSHVDFCALINANSLAGPIRSRRKRRSSAYVDHSGRQWKADQAYTPGGWGYIRQQRHLYYI